MTTLRCSDAIADAVAKARAEVWKEAAEACFYADAATEGITTLQGLAVVFLCRSTEAPQRPQERATGQEARPAVMDTILTTDSLGGLQEWPCADGGLD